MPSSVHSVTTQKTITWITEGGLQCLSTSARNVWMDIGRKYYIVLGKYSGFTESVFEQGWNLQLNCAVVCGCLCERTCLPVVCVCVHMHVNMPKRQSSLKL